MRKILTLTSVCLGALVLSGPALALKSSSSYNIRFDGEKVGTWTLRNKVEESSSSCRYTVKWASVNKTPIASTRLCKIDEYKAGDQLDCEDNRQRFFDTIVAKASGCSCLGFDDAGQRAQITTLVAGEDRHGELTGVVMSASIGDVQSLRITVR